MDKDEDETMRSGRESDCADQISYPEIPFFRKRLTSDVLTNFTS